MISLKIPKHWRPVAISATAMCSISATETLSSLRARYRSEASRTVEFPIKDRSAAVSTQPAMRYRAGLLGVDWYVLDMILGGRGWL